MESLEILGLGTGCFYFAVSIFLSKSICMCHIMDRGNGLDGWSVDVFTRDGLDGLILFRGHAMGQNSLHHGRRDSWTPKNRRPYIDIVLG